MDLNCSRPSDHSEGRGSAPSLRVMRMTPIRRLLYSTLDADPSTSKWLLEAVKTAFERDPVDAVSEIAKSCLRY